MNLLVGRRAGGLGASGGDPIQNLSTDGVAQCHTKLREWRDGKNSPTVALPSAKTVTAKSTRALPSEKIVTAKSNVTLPSDKIGIAKSNVTLPSAKTVTAQSTGALPSDKIVTA